MLIKPEVVVIGEALIDRISTAHGSVDRPGGSPMNVAYGLARLGCPVHFLTSLGDDPEAGLIVDHLTAAGVRLIDGSIGQGRTSTTVASLDGDGAASYRFDVRWQLPRELTLPSAAIVHTGSIAAVLEPGAAVVLEVAQASRAAALISFDPNIRASLILNPDLARARLAQWASIADVVKLSEQDAEWLYPGAPIRSVLDRVLQHGPSLVVVTREAQGAILATETAAVAVPGVAVQVVDSIGAGDAFMSALLYQLHALLSVRTIAALRAGTPYTQAKMKSIGEFAALCAAISVSRAGAALPSLTEATNCWVASGWTREGRGDLEP